MVSINESVGDKGKNKPIDVIKIQDLINNNNLYTDLIVPLAVTGKINDTLLTAITSFQANHPSLKMKKPDGLVSPNGKTLENLNQYNNKEGVCKDYYPAGFSGNTFVRFDIDSFIELYELQYPIPQLGAAARLGLNSLINRLINDTDITDIRWAAYMLATVKHECANKWEPIEEYGRGASKDYGNAVMINDPNDKTGKKKLSNTYYGRGYVQLTWEDNYKIMDTALGLSGNASLHLYPKNALEPEAAYKIMSYGMRNGSFTTKKRKLSDYIVGGSVDYKNARNIINGNDQDILIKGYAENIEFLLRFSNGVQK